MADREQLYEVFCGIDVGKENHRYDKHATIYRAAAVLHAVITWCRNFGGTP